MPKCVNSVTSYIVISHLYITSSSFENTECPYKTLSSYPKIYSACTIFLKLCIFLFLSVCCKQTSALTLSPLFFSQALVMFSCLTTILNGDVQKEISKFNTMYYLLSRTHNLLRERERCVTNSYNV